MNENQEMQEQEQNIDNTAVVEEQVEEAQEKEENIERAFSQDQVNDIVRNRLERYEKKLFNDYGVESRDGLNELFTQARSYNVIKEQYEAQKLENTNLKEENVFLKNNINPERYEDVRAYYKGKGLTFSEESLIDELKTHGEWLKVDVRNVPQTTITTLGTDPQLSIPKKDEKEIAAKLFGLKKLV